MVGCFCQRTTREEQTCIIHTLNIAKSVWIKIIFRERILRVFECIPSERFLNTFVEYVPNLFKRMKLGFQFSWDRLWKYSHSILDSKERWWLPLCNTGTQTDHTTHFCPPIHTWHQMVGFSCEYKSAQPADPICKSSNICVVCFSTSQRENKCQELWKGLSGQPVLHLDKESTGSTSWLFMEMSYIVHCQISKPDFFWNLLWQAIRTRGQICTFEQQIFWTCDFLAAVTVTTIASDTQGNKIDILKSTDAINAIFLMVSGDCFGKESCPQSI